MVLPEVNDVDEEEEEVAQEEGEEEEEEEVDATKSRGKGKAKAKSKSKAKGKAKSKLVKLKAKAKGKATAKGKGKAKAKGRPKPAAAEAGSDEEEEETAASPKKAAKAKAKGSLKSRILAEIGDRNIEEVVAEAKQAVETCEAEILRLETEEQELEMKVAGAQTSLDEAGKQTEDVIHRETIAFEKLKSAKLLMNDVATNTQQSEVDLSDYSLNLKILELENETRDKMKALEEAKQAAQEAAESAQKALQEAKAQEKEVTESLKTSLSEQKDRVTEVVREQTEAEKVGSDTRKKNKLAEKAAQKEAMNEISTIEKTRLARLKERQRRCDEASGLKGTSRGKMLKALPPAPESESPKRGPLPTDEEPPEKMANISQDID